MSNLVFAHSGKAQPLLCAIDQPINASPCRLPCDPFRRKIFFLRSNPVRYVQLRERLALPHRVEWRADVEALEKPVAARLHERDVALVIRGAADGFDGHADRALLNRCRSYAEVLLHTRTDRD